MKDTQKILISPLNRSNIFVFLLESSTKIKYLANDTFPDSTRRGDVEAGRQQSDSSSTSFYTF